MKPEGKWLWKKTWTENFYERFSTSYHLTLVTREPLPEDRLVIALRHLFRKVLLLRACFGVRDGDLWLREMSNEIIDFEVVTDTKADELHRRLHAYDYNKETGPLWCVKLRPEPDCSPDGVSREGEPGFPHMYSLFFGINHAITDGTSQLTICGFLLQILDDVLAGKAIDDGEQLGVFVPDEKTMTLIQEQKAIISADADLRSKLIAEYRILQEKKSYVRQLFDGETNEPHSLLLTQDLDSETTAAFIKRCRAEGVTVNTAFTAMSSIVMVDLLAEGGLEKDTYNIRTDHAVNARRYWGGDTSQYLGCHVVPMVPVIMETPRNVGDEFWQYARLTNEKLHKAIASGKPLQEEALKELVQDGPNPKLQFEYFVTNIGEVTKLLGKGGNHVQVVYCVRSASLDKVACPLLYLLQTFRGKMLITLVYNTFYVTSKLAEDFLERVVQYCKTITTQQKNQLET